MEDVKLIKEFCKTRDEKHLTLVSNTGKAQLIRIITALKSRGDPLLTLKASRALNILQYLIIDVLEMLISSIKISKEKSGYFKIRNYLQAIEAFSEAKEIKNINDASSLLQDAGFKNPEGIMKKVVLILSTGTLPYLADYRDSYFTVRLFSSIPWIGEQTSIKWFHEGYRTIDDIKKAHANKLKLTTAQTISLKYYNQLIDPITLNTRRIPRAEITSVWEIINLKLLAEFQIAGSYRRGLPTSGDVDIIIQAENGRMPDEYFSTISRALKDAGCIFETITKGSNKLLGLYSLPNGLMRRIDILLTSNEQFPYALLYFTGSKDFNRQMRLIAIKKGYKLNEYGLIKTNTSAPNVPEMASEKDIFDFLGMKYLLPSERNII